MDIEDIGAFQAKTRLSELLDLVATGRRFRITKRGKPVAELGPIDHVSKRPRFGRDRGRIRMSRDFDAPLPDFLPHVFDELRRLVPVGQ
jgi:prevent-host-death family protein